MSDLIDWTVEVRAVTGNEDLPDWTWAEVGAGSSAGTPPNAGLPNLVLQYDASRLTGADGSALAAWPAAVGGSTYDLAQTTTANKPTLYTTTTAQLINGLPTVRFAGNQWMRPSSPPAGLAQPLTVYAICGRTTGGDPQVFYDGATSARILLYHTGSTWHGGLMGIAEDLGVADSTGVHFTCLSSPYPSGATFYADGSSANAGVMNAGSPVPFTFGADYTNAAQLTGFICEVGVYSAALSAADVATLRFYAQNKWSTP